jgi:hypothetical protein
MPSFVKGGANRTPFGKNQYARSTQDLKFESYTLAAATVPAQTIDGNAGQKILQSGVTLAKITSGPDAGKVGPYQGQAGTTVTDGRQTAANIVGINDTFLPWQLIEADREVAVCYEGSLVQGWCLEYDNAGLPIPLTNTTAAAMQQGGAAGKGVSMTWK